MRCMSSWHISLLASLPREQVMVVVLIKYSGLLPLYLPYRVEPVPPLAVIGFLKPGGYRRRNLGSTVTDLASSYKSFGQCVPYVLGFLAAIGWACFLLQPKLAVELKAVSVLYARSG